MDEHDIKLEMQNVCSIQIGFPVTSDEQAIEYKRKIGEILADIPNARIDFTLTSIPKRVKRNAP